VTPRSPLWAARVGLVLAVGVVLAGCAGSGASAPSGPGGPGITVAAASDLRFAFEELAGDFTETTGIPVTFSFGSSGLLREQVINGAPFDVFASANVAFVDDVIAAGRGDPETKADYAEGRIVLWAGGGAPPRGVADLADHRYRRIAIANPQHAPYGLAAVEALESTGVLEAVEARLVYGENISDTMRIVSSGNADVGIIALSLAIVDGSDHVLVPEELHRPLRQALVVTAAEDRRGTAEAFVDHLASDAGRALMARYGFVPSGEVPLSDG
jgi:molybdate transport system substrate-binding protein